MKYLSIHTYIDIYMYIDVCIHLFTYQEVVVEGGLVPVVGHVDHLQVCMCIYVSYILSISIFKYLNVRGSSR
jgi:hypothetical protein